MRMFKLLSLILFFYFINEVKLNKSKNDKFLDYDVAHVEFVPIEHGSSLSSLFNYPLIKSKSLNMTDSTSVEKRKQKEIVVKLIDSISFDSALDHQIGKLISADQLPQSSFKYSKVDLSTLSAYRLEVCWPEIAR